METSNRARPAWREGEAGVRRATPAATRRLTPETRRSIVLPEHQGDDRWRPPQPDGDLSMDRPRLTRRVLAATALAGIVAVASAGDSAFAPLRYGKPGSSALVAVLVVAVVAGASGAWLLAVLPHRLSPRADARGGPPLPTSAALRRVFPGAVAMVALVGLLGISRLRLGLEAPAGAAASEDREGREGRALLFWDERDLPTRAGAPDDRPLVPILDDRAVPLASALLFLLVGVGALVWWVGRRPSEGQEAGGMDTEAARKTVLRSIEAMLLDPDPRTAIIGAYARLLEGLAASGAPRRDYEGPMEHLRRSLQSLPVRPGPVARLVDLFQVARFSTQPLAAAHRDLALATLREVAADLGVAGSAAAGSTRGRPREAAS